MHPVTHSQKLSFFSALMEPFTACIKCTSACTIDSKETGTLLTVKQLCTSCGHIRIWNSQPLIGTRGTPAGNLLLSSSILFAGASPTQVLRVLEFMSVSTITQMTFFRHQSQFLIPSVRNVWEKDRTLLITDAQNRGSCLSLGGDGRADSPGHSAKFGSYSMIDLNKNKVIDIQLVQV